MIFRIAEGCQAPGPAIRAREAAAAWPDAWTGAWPDAWAVAWTDAWTDAWPDAWAVAWPGLTAGARKPSTG